MLFTSLKSICTYSCRNSLGTTIKRTFILHNFCICYSNEVFFGALKCSIMLMRKCRKFTNRKVVVLGVPTLHNIAKQEGFYFPSQEGRYVPLWNTLGNLHFN